MPFILEGSAITIATVLCAMLLGLVMGVPMAVGQVSGGPVTRRAISLYVWFFRGVPILVLLYLFYFGLVYQLNPLTFSLGGKEFVIPIDLSPFAASCIVLGLTSAAYQSQIFRGAINSVLHIILPQALRLSIPGWSNEYSILLKDSALVSVLGTMELMSRTKAIATSTAEYSAFYLTAALLYFLITILGVRSLRWAEKSLRIPGYTHL